MLGNFVHPENVKPMCRTFNRLVMDWAMDAMPEGFDVIVGAPNTYPDLVEYYRQHKRIAVEKTGSGGCMMGKPEEHYVFRAWHDLHHVLYDCDFTLDGEKKVALIHQGDIIRRLGFGNEAFFLGALVEVEVVALNQSNIRHGEYPHDPHAFAERWLKDRHIIRPRGL